MKCSKHKNSDAVASCTACHAGVCKVCADATMSLRNECGTLCIPCYTNTLNSTIYWLRQTKTKTLILNIINLIFYIIGIVLFFIGQNQESAGMTVVGMLFAGVFSAIKGWFKEKADQEDYEQKHGERYKITESGIVKDTNLGFRLFMTFAYLAMGLFTTPFAIIKAFIEVFKLKNLIEDLEVDVYKASRI